VRAAKGLATAGGLAGIAALHVAWGRGSSFPFATRPELADAVIGTEEVPSAGACYTVATGLLAGAGLVLNTPPIPAGLRRTGLLIMSGVFGVRASLGWLGRTDLVSPGSESTRFRRLDRRVYSPLCAALAAGSLRAFSARRPAGRPSEVS
jgi:Protein of unknown function (DUF3995)